MSWEDRLKEAAYTPPSGTRLTFTYEDVSREVDKKTTVFNFPDKDGSYVQDLGPSGDKYPLRVILWGENHDQQAETFYKALKEAGPGVLEHPKYGRKDVVPAGTIRQRDDLKTRANQSVFEVVFWESIIDLTFPNADTNAAAAVAGGIDDYSSIAPQQFADTLDITTSGEEVGFTGKFTAGLDVVRASLSSVAATEEGLHRQFNALYDGIVDNLNELIGEPLRLATEVIALVRLPAQAAALIGAKLDGYANIVSTLTSQEFAPSYDNQPQNALIGAELIATAAHIGAIESTLENVFESKPEALTATEVILASFTTVSTWGDDSRDVLGVIDTGETYQAILNTTSVSAGLLVEISFTLLQENIFTLTTARTMVELVAELYGELDEKLDFFISSNDLVGTELLEIPAGREIRFYE